MRNGWRGAFVMALEVVSLSMGIASAGGSWITFSGAVVNPTCGVPAAGLAGAVPAAVAVRGACGASTDALPGAAGADPTRFERVVVRLTDHESMPLLSKFSDDAAAASPRGERPLLVVQTYE